MGLSWSAFSVVEIFFMEVLPPEYHHTTRKVSEIHTKESINEENSSLYMNSIL